MAVAQTGCPATLLGDGPDGIQYRLVAYTHVRGGVKVSFQRTETTQEEFAPADRVVRLSARQTRSAFPGRLCSALKTAFTDLL